MERRIPGGRIVYLPQPGNGRGDVRFLQYEIPGHHYVIPADAARHVAAGKLDEQLFDVPRLLAEGDDTELRLVVQHGEQIAALGAARRLASLPGSAVRVPKTETVPTWSKLTDPGVTKVWLDRKVQVSLRDSMPQIGMPAAWSAGYTGKGVKVAVLDTGVDAGHPDLAGAVVAERDFTGSASGTADRYGHGTHVSSIIRGTGAADDDFRGGAPATSLLSGKVLDDWGSGYISWVVAGMEWAAGNGARIVNLSLGTSAPSAGDDVMSVAVDRLTKQTGALFVVAAGNNPAVLGSPAAAREALTVGAVTKQDVVAGFSARGPRAFDSLLKPEIAAPGVDITAARAKDTEMGTPVGDRYTTASGTSMAAPHVAAAAAVLAESRPGWRAPELKAALTSSAKGLPGETVYAQGAGRVDVARLVRQSVHASPGGVSFGQVYEQEQSQVVTVHNIGTAPVSLRLALDVRDKSGNPAPAGMFGTDVDRVVIPAAGTAQVTVRARTHASAPPGNYSGWLVGADGQDVVRVPIALTKEAVPHHNIDLVTLDSTGKPATGYPICVSLDTGERCQFVQRENGRLSARVPAGRHLVAANVFEPGSRPDTWQVSAIVRFVSIGADSTFVLDARTARPSQVTVDRPDGTDLGAMLTVACDTPAGKAMFSAAAARLADLRIAPAKDESGSKCRSTFGTVLVSEKDASWTYHLVFPSTGDIPEPKWTVRDDRLAVVEARNATQGAVPQHAVKTVSPISDGWFVVPWNSLTVPLPGVRTEYRSPGPWTWYTYFNTYTDGEMFLSQQIANTTYPAAGPVTERWNAAVFGPSLAPVDSAAYRFGNTVLFQIPLYGDQSPDHSGYLPGMTGTVSLFRDHELIGPGSIPFGNVSAWAQLPAEPGRYRLVVDAEQAGAGTPLSPRINAEWTFHSRYLDDTTQISLPLHVVRFAPPVDERNTAPAGRAFRVPVAVQRVAGAPPAVLMGISVFASYDEGTTWHPVQLLPTATGWDAVLHHPPDARTVSLRTTATDDGGNSVQQTILRAYDLK